MHACVCAGVCACVCGYACLTISVYLGYDVAELLLGRVLPQCAHTRAQLCGGDGLTPVLVEQVEHALDLCGKHSQIGTYPGYVGKNSQEEPWAQKQPVRTLRAKRNTE